MKQQKKLPTVSCVYKILNLVTKEFYIGSTKNLYKRWLHHTAKSTWKQDSHKKLYINMQEYGIKNFVCEVLKEYPVEKLRDRESYWIDKLQPPLNVRGLYRDPEIARINKNRLTREWKKAHAEYNRELNRNWRRNNPDKVHQYRENMKKKAGK